MNEEDKPVTAPAGTPVDTAEPYAAVASVPPRKSLSALIMILVGLAFVAGAALAVWAFPRVSRLWTPEQSAPAHLPSVAVAQRTQALASVRPLDATTQDLLDVRIRELEDRLTRITVEAQAASGNAARAEGLLVAVAARRALDSGAPLGYVEGQLRLRFGQAQPRAVATIINAAREPVTLADLEGELEAIGPHLTGNPPDASWWTTFKNEARQMVIIRKSSTPSPLPDRAYRRAQRLLESGRVDAALIEVERLPAHEVADRWLQMARRYREARRALDLIETAAILEPRQIRTGDGAAVAQPSPLAP